MTAEGPSLSGQEPAAPQFAYLVAVHHQPRHLARLIAAANHSGAAFFVHVDAKAELAKYEASIAPRIAEAEREKAARTAALDKELKDYEATLPAKLSALGREDVARVSRAYLDPAKLPVVVVGPKKDQEGLAELHLGPVFDRTAEARGIVARPAPPSAPAAR